VLSVKLTRQRSIHTHICLKFYAEGQEIDAEFLEKMIKMAVSRTEVAVIKKRVDTLNDTTRRKKLRQQAKTDIRDIFSSVSL
jgi:hypothetical protein